MIFNSDKALKFDVESFMAKDTIKEDFNNLINVMEENGITNLTVKQTRNERFVFELGGVAIVSFNHDSESCGIYVTPDPKIPVKAGSPHPIADDGRDLINVWMNGRWLCKSDAGWMPAVKACIEEGIERLRKRINFVPDTEGDTFVDADNEEKAAKAEAEENWSK